jgi:hypothetical protein
MRMVRFSGHQACHRDDVLAGKCSQPRIGTCREDVGVDEGEQWSEGRILSKVEVVDEGRSEHGQRTDKESSQCPPEGRIYTVVGEL